MNKKIVFLAACLQLSPVFSEESSVLQDNALAQFDFSFLPENVAEFDGERLSSAALISLLEYKLSKLPSSFLSADQLKQITLSFIEQYYERKVNLKLAYEAGIQKNEGVAELELQLLQKQLGKDALLKQFEFTGKKHYEMVSFFAEEKVLQKYFKDQVYANCKVNEAEAIEFYFDNQKLFFKEESIKIAQIYSGFIQGNDKEAALKKINAGMSRLTSGEDFGEVANDFSFGEKSKEKGFIDQYFTEVSLRPALKECFDLEVGSVSGILESTNGYHIVKVIERQPAGQQEFGDVKSQLMQNLSLEKAKKELHRRIVQRMKKGGFKLYIQP